MVGRAEFEQALRYDEQLLTAAANVTIPSGKESVAIPGAPVERYGEGRGGQAAAVGADGGTGRRAHHRARSSGRCGRK